MTVVFHFTVRADSMPLFFRLRDILQQLTGGASKNPAQQINMPGGSVIALPGTHAFQRGPGDSCTLGEHGVRQSLACFFSVALNGIP